MKRTLIGLISLSMMCFGMAAVVLAQDTPESTPTATSQTPIIPLEHDVAPMHPVFPLLDADGANVLVTDNPVSTMTTCGTCHDTAFIAEHTRHGNGGTLAAGTLPPDQAIPVSAEMNCFLCHTAEPDNQARLDALATGQAEWASTATLIGSGIVVPNENGYTYNPDAFMSDDTLKREYITLRPPHSDNCGACHGLVHMDNQTPLSVALGNSSQWRTFTTGQVTAAQRISASGINLTDRENIDRPWDVHTERVINCVNCHFSITNPVYTRATAGAAPEHLTFDPRRADSGDYLLRPSHEFAAGIDSMRSCINCHDGEVSHSWLPYWEKHTSALACETCHIPQLYAPALALRDATVVRVDGSPVDLLRGMGDAFISTSSATSGTLVTGYQPVLLQQIDADGSQQLSPYNLVSLWYWGAGDVAQPVSANDLRAAYLKDGAYAPEVVDVFDADGDGQITDDELVLDSDAKTELIEGRLTALGIETPRIVGEIKAYPIHHDVIGGEWAIRDCETCHTDDSRLAMPLSLGSRTPGGITPAPGDDQMVQWNGSIERDDAGTLWFAPQTDTPVARLYIFGHDSVELIDTLGVIVVLLASFGVTVHATLRVIAGRRRIAHTQVALRHEYMYSLYERQWHWLQTFVILGLIFTGMVIHRPAMFPLFSFAWMVEVHNVFALLLVINAALALFYHLASGEIKQFIPRPYGFFDDMIEQALYYLRGIFKGDEHPFEKRRDRKMNPIQQLTYLALLNVLLPLQIVTGALIWGAQQFPALTATLGGLPVLAPFHTLIAWLLVTFVIVHVYMTTTGHTPLANIRAMVMGYDDVEVHEEKLTAVDSAAQAGEPTG